MNLPLLSRRAFSFNSSKVRDRLKSLIFSPGFHLICFLSCLQRLQNFLEFLIISSSASFNAHITCLVINRHLVKVRNTRKKWMRRRRRVGSVKKLVQIVNRKEVLSYALQIQLHIMIAGSILNELVVLCVSGFFYWTLAAGILHMYIDIFEGSFGSNRSLECSNISQYGDDEMVSKITNFIFIRTFLPQNCACNGRKKSRNVQGAHDQYCRHPAWGFPSLAILQEGLFLSTLGDF